TPSSRSGINRSFSWRSCGLWNFILLVGGRSHPKGPRCHTNMRLLNHRCACRSVKELSSPLTDDPRSTKRGEGTEAAKLSPAINACSKRQASRLLVGTLCLLSLATQLNGQATSREQEIEQQRTDKRARLWPERTSGLVKQFDKYTEKGLFEGAQSKKGK